ncbi:MAG: hypothetical protein QXL67_04825 [Candidatus Bathyarchaeia archaeon]
MRNALSLLLALAIIGLASYQLMALYSRFPYEKVDVIEGDVDLEVGKDRYVKLPKLKDKSRVMVELHTKANIQISILQEGKIREAMPVIIEGFKYRLVDYLINIQRGLCIAEESEKNYIVLKAVVPLTGYHVIFPLEEYTDGEVKISEANIGGERALNITVTRGEFEDFISAMLVYTVDLTATDEFNLRLKYSLHPTNSNSSIRIDLVSETDNYVYSVEVSNRTEEHSLSTYVLKASENLWKSGSIQNDKITSICLRLTLHPKEARASFMIGGVEISDSGQNIRVEAEAKERFNVPYTIYITHKYSPDIYASALWLTVFLSTLYIWRLGSSVPRELLKKVFKSV